MGRPLAIHPASPPCALTIAGSDSSGGAGIQADLKVFDRLGVYGLSVVTAVTAQNGRSITRIERLAPPLVEAQLDAVLDAFDCRAIKVGMLGSEGIARAIGRRLDTVGEGVAVVLDPILAASGGEPLLESAVVATLLDLLPRTTLVTPNLPEAERLSGIRIVDEQSVEAAGRWLAGRGPAVLLKGGHGTGGRVVDRLFVADRVQRFERPRIAGPSPHGTGCALSSAVTAYLARGEELEAAVSRGIGYLAQLLEHPLDFGGARFLGTEGRSSS